MSDEQKWKAFERDGTSEQTKLDIELFPSIKITKTNVPPRRGNPSNQAIHGGDKVLVEILESDYETYKNFYEHFVEELLKIENVSLARAIARRHNIII